MRKCSSDQGVYFERSISGSTFEEDSYNFSISQSTNCKNKEIYRHAVVVFLSNNPVRAISLDFVSFFFFHFLFLIEMASMKELVQVNFKLNSEVKRLKNQLVTLQAMKEFEEGEEVKRIKSAYESLESELVHLRRLVKAPPVEESSPKFPVNNGVLDMLSHQLSAERDKYASLEHKYLELRKELSSQSVSYASTSVGSPSYKLVNFSLHSFPCASIAPPSPSSSSSSSSSSCPSRTSVGEEKSDDGTRKRCRSAAFNRLSKIARFKPS